MSSIPGAATRVQQTFASIVLKGLSLLHTALRLTYCIVFGFYAASVFMCFFKSVRKQGGLVGWLVGWLAGCLQNDMKKAC